MDRDDYFAKLKEIQFELLGLVGEAMTDDDNDRLAGIAAALDDFLQLIDEDDSSG